MKLKRIDYYEHETEGNIPEVITVELTARELVYLAKLLGKQSGEKAEEIMHGGWTESSNIYGCLTGEVANRWFDGGVDHWARVVAK